MSQASDELIAQAVEAKKNRRLDLYRKHREASTLDVANALRGAALLKELNGQTEQAIVLWCEATRLYEEADIPEAVDEGSHRLARLREKVAQNQLP